MKNLLIDTDVLIGFLRGEESARGFLLSAINDYAILCSAITVAEIHAGMRESERQQTEALLDSLSIVDITKKVAEKAGNYKKEEKRQALELDDCLVAASAFTINAVLATGNGKHYPMAEINKVIVQ